MQLICLNNQAIQLSNRVFVKYQLSRLLTVELAEGSGLLMRVPHLKWTANIVLCATKPYKPAHTRGMQVASGSWEDKVMCFLL